MVGSERTGSTAVGVLGTFGVSEEEVELLLEVGYDPDEIEELLMDTAAMEEAISEAKTLLQCEA